MYNKGIKQIGSDNVKLKNISKAVLVGALLISPLAVATEGAQTVQAASTIAKKSVKYTNTTVQLKASRHSKAKTVNTIPKGKTVQYLKGYGSWSQVKYGSKTGYVPTKTLVSSISLQATKTGTLKISTDLKATRHSKSKTLVKIASKAPVFILKDFGSWTQVKYRGKTGYIPTRNLNSSGTPAKPAPVTSALKTPEQVISFLNAKKSMDYEISDNRLYYNYSRENVQFKNITFAVEKGVKEPFASLSIYPNDLLQVKAGETYSGVKADYNRIYKDIADSIFGKDTASAKEFYAFVSKETDTVVTTTLSQNVKPTYEEKKIGGLTFINRRGVGQLIIHPKF